MIERSVRVNWCRHDLRKLRLLPATVQLATRLSHGSNIASLPINSHTARQSQWPSMLVQELGGHWAQAHLFEADPGIAVLSCPCAPVRHSRGASPQPLPPRQTIVPLGVHRSTKLPHAYGRTATASCWGTTDMSHHNNTSDTTLTICAADSRNISAPRIAG